VNCLADEIVRYRLPQVATPTEPDDIANKAYVDANGGTSMSLLEWYFGGGGFANGTFYGVTNSSNPLWGDTFTLPPVTTSNGSWEFSKKIPKKSIFQLACNYGGAPGTGNLQVFLLDSSSRQQEIFNDSIQIQQSYELETVLNQVVVDEKYVLKFIFTNVLGNIRVAIRTKIY